MAVSIVQTVAIGGLAYALVTGGQTVVMIAPDGGRRDVVARDEASRSYIESWALYLAETLGDVTPSSVAFVKDHVGPLLCPAIYDKAMVMLSDQAATVARDHISIAFEPSNVVVEQATGKVFVDGEAVDRTVVGVEKRYERTFEFLLSVGAYRIRLCGLDSYEGAPRTQQKLAQMKQHEPEQKPGGSP